MFSERFRRLVLPLVPPLVLAILWEGAAQLGLINTVLFPPPSTIVTALFRSMFGEVGSSYELFPNMAATLYRLFWGFFYGAVSGILLGVLIGNFSTLRALVEPVVIFIMPIPGIALAPLFMVAMGFGDKTIIAVGAVAMFFPVVLNIINGVRSVSKSLDHAATIMGVSATGRYFTVQLPWTMPFLITGLKLGLARCWRTIIAVELIATATNGLGFMITEASGYLQTDMFFVGIIVMASIFLFIEKVIFGALERATVVKWGMVR